MAEKKPAKKMGRPRKTVDWEQFDKLCSLQCSGEEIAAFFGMCYETLNTVCKREKNATFLELFAEKRVHGKIALRRRQYQAAIEGNSTMLVWLGKNWLQQNDQLNLQALDKEGEKSDWKVTFVNADMAP